MAAMLRLDTSWAPAEPENYGNLVVQHGKPSALTYDDGISLRVELIDPARHTGADGVIAQARTVASSPGQVPLVGGAVPVEWRAALRQAGVSFLDVGGVVEITWPRLRVSSAQFGREVVRRRTPTALQKSHALVAEELLIATLENRPLTVTELARQAVVHKSIASRAAAQLAAQGLVERDRGRSEILRVPSPSDLAALLAARTAWPGRETVAGYAWGRTILDTAATISHNAAEAGIKIAITGRVGAAFLGILATSAPPQVHCWTTVDEQSLDQTATMLGLEPTSAEGANVRISADRWRTGVHRRGDAQLDELTATVAHPVRVWCDLHSEPRGTEFAAQLWGEINNARRSGSSQ